MQGLLFTPAFELKSAQMSLMVLAVRRFDLDQLQIEISQHVAKAPALLKNAPVVLDLGQADPKPTAHQVTNLLMRTQVAGLRVVALVADAIGEPLAHAVGLPALTVGPRRKKSDEAPAKPTEAEAAAAPTAPEIPATPDANPGAEAAPQEPAEDAPAEPVAVPPLLLPGPIRGGQQIYAKGRDLIITGAVSAGAEVAADGCVHVYGRLSGKALAGAAGDVRARIYCLSFGPELVSIAGNFKVFESAPREIAGKAVEIYLNEGRVDVRPLKA